MKKLNHLFPFIFAIAFAIAGCIPDSFTVSGSSTSYLGVINILVPALSSLFSSAFIAAGFVGYCILKLLAGTYPITCGIPTIMSILSLRSLSSAPKTCHLLLPLLVNFSVPLGCVAAFCIHPVGGRAPGYVIFWFIPVVVGLKYAIANATSTSTAPISQDSSSMFFTKALAASFVAHAVGSVIYLYVRPHDPAFWNALIIRVAVERFLFATGMTLIYVCFPRSIIEKVRDLYAKGMEKTVNLFARRLTSKK